ncbi:uncharacterized protein LOC118742231 isoform X4 [Rhagoletis pomonella]|uniref:uncharacterized protein LOC118742231 isoform X4 n=1 Tax=Rhagoletis pomonella TaxID=28610 RepID=UPI00178361E8|nr:uncharacterized protein LOC118742231 isoform X4 [Rhagoletis pomonella]
MNPEKLSNSSKIRQNVKTATDLQRMKLEKLMMNPVCCREVGFEQASNRANASKGKGL